jgi:hypothetical protein
MMAGAIDGGDAGGGDWHSACAQKARRFDRAQSSFLDSFQSASGSLESLEKTLFLFASRHHVKYR